jgi:hypothetical protein
METRGYNPDHPSRRAERRESVHKELDSETRHRDQLQALRRTLEIAPTTGV